MYTEYIYDENGRLVKELDYHAENDEIYNTIVYAYCENGQLLQKKENFLTMGYIYTTDYMYDAEDKLVYEKETNAEGEITKTIEYIYDEDGKLQREEINWFNGGYIIYNYDTEGRRLSLESFNPKGELEYLIEYTYSVDGLETKATKKERDISSVIWISREYYNEDEDLVELRSYDAEGIYTGHERYTYDEVGNMIQVAEYNKDGRIDYLWMTWEYDASGKCTKYTQYSYYIPMQ